MHPSGISRSPPRSANPDPTRFRCCCCIDFRFVSHAAGREDEEWPWQQISKMVRHSCGMAVFAVGVSYSFHGGTTVQYESCTNRTVADIVNGRCDAALNVASCGFDGGDCCPCTCSNAPDHSCSDNNFDCVYPDCDGPTITMFGDQTPTSGETTCKESRVGDGLCDFSNIHVGCSWDGGDGSLTWLELRLILLTIHVIVGALSGCLRRWKMWLVGSARIACGGLTMKER